MSKLKVSNEIYFLGAIAVIAFLFCVYNLVNLLLIQNKSATTTGTIISYTTAIPSTTAFHNSKWAQLTYKVNGKQYVSQKAYKFRFPLKLEAPCSFVTIHSTRKGYIVLPRQEF